MVPTAYGHRLLDVKDAQPAEIDMAGELHNSGVFYRPWQWGGGIDLWCLDHLDEVNRGEELPQRDFRVRGGGDHVEDGDL